MKNKIFLITLLTFVSYNLFSCNNQNENESTDNNKTINTSDDNDNNNSTNDDKKDDYTIEIDENDGEIISKSDAELIFKDIKDYYNSDEYVIPTKTIINGDFSNIKIGEEETEYISLDEGTFEIYINENNEEIIGKINYFDNSLAKYKKEYELNFGGLTKYKEKNAIYITVDSISLLGENNSLLSYYIYTETINSLFDDYFNDYNLSDIQYLDDSESSEEITFDYSALLDDSYIYQSTGNGNITVLGTYEENNFKISYKDYELSSFVIKGESGVISAYFTYNEDTTLKMKTIDDTFTEITEDDLKELIDSESLLEENSK